MKISKVILLNLVLFLVSSLVMAASFSSRVIEEKSFKVTSGEKLYVKSDVGDIQVNTWSNSEVAIKIIGNSKAESKMKFKLNETSEGVEVLGKKTGSGWFNWISGIDLRYEIMVPESFTVELRTSGGNIEVTDLEGTKYCSTSGGNIAFEDCSDEGVAKTSGGNISVVNNKGSLELNTSGGNIKAERATGDIKARTSGGRIVLQVADGMVDASTSGGSIKLDYTGDNKGIDLHTSGGSIKVAVPSDLKANVVLATSGGSVKSDFSAARVYEVKSSKMKAEFNGGGEKLVAKTSGGSVRLTEK